MIPYICTNMCRRGQLPGTDRQLIGWQRGGSRVEGKAAILPDGLPLKKEGQLLLAFTKALNTLLADCSVIHYKHTNTSCYSC